MNDQQILELSAAGLAAAIRDRKVSALRGEAR